MFRVACRLRSGAVAAASDVYQSVAPDAVSSPFDCLRRSPSWPGWRWRHGTGPSDLRRRPTPAPPGALGPGTPGPAAQPRSPPRARSAPRDLDHRLPAPAVLRRRHRFQRQGAGLRTRGRAGTVGEVRPRPRVRLGASSPPPRFPDDRMAPLVQCILEACFTEHRITWCRRTVRYVSTVSEPPGGTDDSCLKMRRRTVLAIARPGVAPETRLDAGHRPNSRQRQQYWT